MGKAAGGSAPPALVLAAAATALMGAVAVSAYQEITSARDKQRSEQAERRRQAEERADEDKQAAVKLYMERELENMMILFKRNVPGGSFEEFLLNNFPENVTVDNDGRATCDYRVRNNDWQGRFKKVSGEDKMHVLGPMPM